jgi:hypothetical protein
MDPDQRADLKQQISGIPNISQMSAEEREQLRSQLKADLLRSGQGTVQ